MSANHEFTFTTEAPPPPAVGSTTSRVPRTPLPILGPVAGVVGIVTAKRANGFYMQDPSPDADDATSEGIFVFTRRRPTVNVGDSVRVSGTVVEFRPGSATSTNLTRHRDHRPHDDRAVDRQPASSDHRDRHRRARPAERVIEDDAPDSVETSGVFDPAADGIDFYESLEAMRVQVNNAVVVGPRNSFGEIFVLADNGAGARHYGPRGGIVIRDLGPNHPATSGRATSTPSAFSSTTSRVSPHRTRTSATASRRRSSASSTTTSATSRSRSPRCSRASTTVSTREITTAPSPNELSVATFNVENLDPAEPQSKFDAWPARS